MVRLPLAAAGLSYDEASATSSSVPIYSLYLFVCRNISWDSLDREKKEVSLARLAVAVELEWNGRNNKQQNCTLLRG